MNAQIIMFGVVIAICTVLLFLQGWLLLLNDSGAQPMWILIALLGIVGGFPTYAASVWNNAIDESANPGSHHICIVWGWSHMCRVHRRRMAYGVAPD